MSFPFPSREMHHVPPPKLKTASKTLYHAEKCQAYPDFKDIKRHRVGAKESKIRRGKLEWGQHSEQESWGSRLSSLVNIGALI